CQRHADKREPNRIISTSGSIRIYLKPQHTALSSTVPAEPVPVCVLSGDYFGILMDEKVTGFPFNIMENPMYWGSTANYLGLALIGSSPVGLVLTAIVGVAYKLAIMFEGPFTQKIYQERRKQE
uniref:phosphatidyl-N-methylethanolamine N-methyltransferase n=1 Tax=Oryzias sinensis TaxID=183150 RepID=A0A8C7X034_9TELE